MPLAHPRRACYFPAVEWAPVHWVVYSDGSHSVVHLEIRQILLEVGVYFCCLLWDARLLGCSSVADPAPRVVLSTSAT